VSILLRWFPGALHHGYVTCASLLYRPDLPDRPERSASGRPRGLGARSRPGDTVHSSCEFFSQNHSRTGLCLACGLRFRRCSCVDSVSPFTQTTHIPQMLPSVQERLMETISSILVFSTAPKLVAPLNFHWPLCCAYLLLTWRLDCAFLGFVYPIRFLTMLAFRCASTAPRPATRLLWIVCPYTAVRQSKKSC